MIIYKACTKDDNVLMFPTYRFIKINLFRLEYFGQLKEVGRGFVLWVGVG